MRLLLAFALLFVVVVARIPQRQEKLRLQGVAAKGRLLCGTKPIVGATVKIIDRDEAKGDPDDLLDEIVTDEDGRFELSGATREEETMQAALKIYHDCNDEKKPCQRKVKWNIPQMYNNNGTIYEWFELGEVNMETEFLNEERDCRHRRRRRHHRHMHN